MPQVLMAMMRHESIDTTLRYYVGRNALTTADAAWAAYEEKSLQGQSSTETSTVDQKPAKTKKGTKAESVLCQRVIVRGAARI